MVKRTKSERRQHPRLEQKLPVNVAADGYGFATVTKNISCLGAYCHIDKYMPPFTRVAVKLALPLAVKTGERDSNVECKGVVVRTEDDINGGFNIAIFFNEIKDTQRNKISRYISQFLPEESPSSSLL